MMFIEIKLEIKINVSDVCLVYMGCTATHYNEA